MLRLKNIATVSLLFLITLFAQDALAQRGQRGDMVERLKQEIELTAEQETEIRAIAEKYQVRVAELRNSSTERGANREAIKELRQAQRADIQKVLTPAQVATLEEKRGANRAERKEKWSKVDKKGLKSELKAYREQNIKPVLAAQRVQLETKITPTDRATLAELRTVLGEAKAERKADRKKGQRPTKEERAAKRAAFETKYANEIATLKSLTQKYDAELEQIRTTIQAQVDQWKKDTRAITKKYLAEADIEDGRQGKRKHKKMGETLQGEKAKSRFLLMEPAS